MHIAAMRNKKDDYKKTTTKRLATMIAAIITLVLKIYRKNCGVFYQEMILIVTTQPHLNHNPTPTQQKVG